jgi:hypothetical protein
MGRLIIVVGFIFFLGFFFGYVYGRSTRGKKDDSGQVY